jgi:hypothetical protein
VPKCFAIMPISTPAGVRDRYSGDQDHFIHVAEYIFQPRRRAGKAGYDFCPPAVISSDIIQAEIIRNLEESELVLCDINFGELHQVRHNGAPRPTELVGHKC